MSRVRVESYVRVQGAFRPIRSVQRYDDSTEHVPGAISLLVDEVELLGVELWDDVNWLWPYVVKALDDCRRTGSGKRYFPDQPIAFEAKKLPRAGSVLLTVRDAGSLHRSVRAPLGELYEEVGRAGLDFFQELRRLCGVLELPVASEKDEATMRTWLADSPKSNV
ncbi:hypothetical protein [Cellulomonas terrae]|uniref:Uncharacterized protein n=1 Tax=Cellulomonas terrae TaxID=311234 RepID=A0A511JKJ7_9CELL|nr:hypothetical protein [Cellulomonas terrae]GEL98530.1 hypothetical protein CTE05_20770 [Cellulomonas terrae]